MAEEEPEGCLTGGSLARCAKSQVPKDDFIVQVLSGCVVGGGRVKLMVHDTVNSMDCLLKPEFNGWWSTQIGAGTVLQFTGGNCNPLNCRNVLIGDKMEILQKECESLTNGTDPPLVPQPKAPAAKKASFGARSGFGGNNAFGSRPSGNNAFANRKPRNNAGGERYNPVKSLNPFMKDFRVKVRVTGKQDIRHWKNAKGEGKLFNVNFLDNEGTEIQGTAFNDAVDALYPQFEKGKVYVIRKARVKISNKRFTHIKHEYQLDLGADTEVTEAGEDAAIQEFHFNFKTIADVTNMKQYDFVDLIGVITSAGDLRQFTSKKGNELIQRNFTIADQSSTCIDCTLWGEAAQAFDAKASLHKVIALQAAKVSEYNGKSISVSTIIMEPNIPETQQMKTWYQQNQGNLAGMNKLTSSSGGGGKDEPPINASTTKGMGMNEEGKAEYFNSILTVGYIPFKEDRPPWYKACPSPEVDGKQCKKKVMENGEGSWRCEGCNQDFSSYTPRWVLKIKAMDHTDSMWLSCFDDQAEIITGMSAKEAETQKDQDLATFETRLNQAVFSTWNCRIRAKKDEYNDQVRQRLDCLRATPVDLQADLKRLSDQTRQLLQAAA